MGVNSQNYSDLLGQVMASYPTEYAYTAYLRLGGVYVSGVKIRATSPRAAADKRLALVQNPESYQGVAVAGNYSITEFEIKAKTGYELVTA